MILGAIRVVINQLKHNRQLDSNSKSLMGKVDKEKFACSILLCYRLGISSDNIHLTPYNPDAEYLQDWLSCRCSPFTFDLCRAISSCVVCYSGLRRLLHCWV